MEREGSETPTVFSSATKGVQLVGDDELQVDGKMYDIVKTRVHNGVKYYYAVGDHEEDTYVHKLVNAEKDGTGVNSLPAKTFKLYELKYVAVTKSLALSFTPSHDLTDFSCITTPLIYLSHFKDIFSPPPNHFLS